MSPKPNRIVEEAADMRIALFIDIENLVRSAETMGLPTDVGPILEKLQEFGVVQVRRSYGDLEKNIPNDRERVSIRKMLHNNLVHMEDIPYITQSKNTADIQLVVEAMSLAYQDENIDCFAVVASDRDYVPLFNRLREMGRTVVGVGIDRENMNSMFRKACDRLFYYESLFGSPKEKGVPESDSDVMNLNDAYYEVLGHAVKALEKQDRAALGTRLAQMMRHLRSDFDPADVGCTSFKRFIQKAEKDGIVTVEWPQGAGDFEVSLKAEPPSRGPARRGKRPSRKDPKSTAERFREILETKRRVPLLDLEKRRIIIRALQESYEARTGNGELSLREWTEAAFQLLGSNGHELTQSNVFKTALGLYFARCFRCQQSGEDLNPTIMGLAEEPQAWEDRLHYQYVRTIRASEGSEALTPEAVSVLLFEDDQHKDDARRIIEQVTGG